jgi:formylglycine-generating enzyme required for sulfatase activity/serine/threonine protein kinase
MMFDQNAVLSEGTWIENFEIGKKLGRGGFGVTYQAKEFHRTASGAKHELRLVALKEFFPRGLAYRIADSRVAPAKADNEERPDLAFFSALKAFIREAQAVMRVEHANVVQIYQVFESHGTAYFAMPLLKGLSLQSRLKKVGTLSQSEIERLVLPLLDGIEAVHELGIIHRDIKPDNIMLREGVNERVIRPILIDFGAARVTAVDDTRQFSRSIYTGASDYSLISITDGFSPPEQYSPSSGTNKPSPYNDVYAFCATLYRSVTGVNPCDSPQRALDIQCRKPDPLLTASRARSGEQSYSPALLAAIDWGLELDPAKRPQTVAQLRDALLGNAPIPERAVTKPTIVRAPPPKGPGSSEPELAVPVPQPPQAPRIPIPATPRLTTAGSLNAFLKPVPQYNKPTARSSTKWPRIVAGCIALVMVTWFLIFVGLPVLQTNRFAEDEALERRRINALPSPAPPPVLSAERYMFDYAVGQTFNACGTYASGCPEMVVIPAGSFLMGSSESERVPVKFSRGGYVFGFNETLPQHTVTLRRNFAVSKYEVTFAQWDACVAAGGCSHKPVSRWGGGSQPVHSVSWDDITRQYIPWLNKKTTGGYRLLTEAEWEYAARGGTTTAFHTGDTINSSQANFKGDYSYNGSVQGINRAKTVPVGSLNTPNKFGLHDMHGNVSEWVQDCFHETYHGAPQDGRAWEEANDGDCKYRVLRSGSWNDRPVDIRSAFRHWTNSNTRLPYFGFRLARTLP